jgi:hypothetical protein
MTMPAKNAPSAKETLNNLAAPNAMPMAAATTARVNNSLEPVPAICQRSQGITRRPTIIIKPMKAPTCSSVLAMVIQTASLPDTATALPPRSAASGGKRTNTRTVAKSSTISQPTAIRPFMLSSIPRASSALSNTTVLAQDNDKPKSNPWPHGQPHHQDAAIPSSVAQVICTTAPGTAIRLTASKGSATFFL